MEGLSPKTGGNGYEQARKSNDVGSISTGSNTVGESISFPKRRIKKVPEFLKRVQHNKGEYDPSAVSLGPYHYGRLELKFVEDFKPKALEFFVARSGHDTDFFYRKVMEVIIDVRNCYEENLTDKYDNFVFCRMMLHDACLFINIIDMIVNNQQELWPAIVGHLGGLVLNLVYRDLWLLENQIPFWFLKHLINLKFGEAVGEQMLTSYLNMILNNGVFEKTTKRNQEEEEEPLHLLEASRRILVSSGRKEREANRGSVFEACLRPFFSKIQWFSWRKKINARFDIKQYVRLFRSVTDLKAKRIHFRPSPTDSFKDIEFTSSYFYGKLQLPTWVVTKNTKPFFLNLIAFEMCPNNFTDGTVSTYINFMKSLLESPKDVKELREKQIIFNMLGSDEEVLQVYKDINTYGNDDLGMFYKVQNDIQEHYNNKGKTWLAEFINTYFSSPWSAIALLAAIVLLCLTITQTYFTIHPSS